MTRVLLAEDDPLVRGALAEMLRGGGVEVVAVKFAVSVDQIAVRSLLGALA